MVSFISYLGRAQLLSRSCPPTGDKLQLLSLGPIYLLPQNEFKSAPFLQFLEIFSLRRIGVNSSLNVWYNSSVKLPGPGLLFVGRIFMTDSISLLVIGLSIFSISS